MSCRNPAAGRGRCIGIGLGPRVRWLPSGAVALLGLLAAGCAVPAGSGANFPNPPRLSPVTLPVLVSANGRVITGLGPLACGHDPRLAARSYPRKVTLTWVSPDTSCHAEVIRSAAVSVRLPGPLGDRALVQASGSGRVRYFSQRNLARVTVLPSGFRFSSDLPSESFPESDQWAVGDTRTYAGPSGAGAQLQIAQLAVTAGKGIIPLTSWPWPGHARVHGRAAALLADRSGSHVYSRSITWVDHGYRFVVGVSVTGPRQVPLSDAQLIAVANGIRLRPSQDH
jgi:hypothetical protein